MAATNRFLALTPDNYQAKDVLNTSSTTAAAYVELRMLITQSDGTTATNLSRRQVIMALEAMTKYLLRGGVNEFINGTGVLPLPTRL